MFVHFFSDIFSLHRVQTKAFVRHMTHLLLNQHNYKLMFKYGTELTFLNILLDIRVPVFSVRLGSLRSLYREYNIVGLSWLTDIGKRRLHYYCSHRPLLDLPFSRRTFVWSGKGLSQWTVLNSYICLKALLLIYRILGMWT